MKTVKILLLATIITATNSLIISASNPTEKTNPKNKKPKDFGTSSSTTLSNLSEVENIDNWLEEDEEIKQLIKMDERKEQEQEEQHQKYEETASQWLLKDPDLWKEYNLTPPNQMEKSKKINAPKSPPKNQSESVQKNLKMAQQKAGQKNKINKFNK